MSAPDIVTTPPPPWAPIEAALRALSFPASPVVGAIPYRTAIPSIARNLWLIGTGVDKYDPYEQPASQKTAHAELALIGRQADALRQSLESMHAPVAKIIGRDPEALASLKTKLWNLSIVARHSVVAPTSENTGRGRKTAIRARDAALKCGEEFYRLTGKIPTVSNPPGGGPAYGDFLDLVTALFTACRSKARPEMHARQACEYLRRELDKK